MQQPAAPASPATPTPEIEARIDELMQQGMSREEALRYLLSENIAGSADPYGDLYERQGAIADSLREYDAEGRQAGNVYVAANPLEHLNEALSTGLAAKIDRDAGDKYRGEIEKEKESRRAIADLLRRLSERDKRDDETDYL